MSDTFTTQEQALTTQEQAQEIADFYQKVADGGEIQTYVRGPLDSNPEWVNSVYGPRPNCLEFRYWRIKPTKKVIDLSVLIKSGIDCEFSAMGGACFNRKLIYIAPFKRSVGRYQDDHNCFHERCQPRINHKHAWQGGECPLPEGFMVKVWLRDSYYDDGGGVLASEMVWSHDNTAGDIIAFEVLEKLADGYVMPGEVSDAKTT